MFEEYSDYESDDILVGELVGDEINIEKDNDLCNLNKDIKCSYCENCPYPINMLSIIKFDEKYYNVCDSNKISLYNKLLNEKNNGSCKTNLDKNLKTNNNFKEYYINDEIFNIENDIFSYQIFTDHYVYNEYIKSINLDKSIGLNSNRYYLNFIKSLPWTNELDKFLDNYTNCSELMENHFRKRPDRPNITFGNLPIKYNRIYYQYILYTNENCIECQKDEETNCIIYNKLINFLNKKFSKIKKIDGSRCANSN